MGRFEKDGRGRAGRVKRRVKVPPKPSDGRDRRDVDAEAEDVLSKGSAAAAAARLRGSASGGPGKVGAIIELASDAASRLLASRFSQRTVLAAAATLFAAHVVDAQNFMAMWRIDGLPAGSELSAEERVQIAAVFVQHALAREALEGEPELLQLTDPWRPPRGMRVAVCGALDVPLP